MTQSPYGPPGGYGPPPPGPGYPPPAAPSPHGQYPPQPAGYAPPQQGGYPAYDFAPAPEQKKSKIWAVLTAVGALLLVGELVLGGVLLFGGDRQDQSAPSSAASSTPKASLDDMPLGQLFAILPTKADFPDNWRVNNSIDPLDRKKSDPPSSVTYDPPTCQPIDWFTDVLPETQITGVYSTEDDADHKLKLGMMVSRGPMAKALDIEKIRSWSTSCAAYKQQTDGRDPRDFVVSKFIDLPSGPWAAVSFQRAIPGRPGIGLVYAKLRDVVVIGIEADTSDQGQTDLATTLFSKALKKLGTL